MLLNDTIQKIKFNNHLIKAIVENDRLRDCFKLFLTMEATNWLERSKIKDKQTYLDAFKLYEKLCDRDSSSEDAQGSNN